MSYVNQYIMKQIQQCIGVQHTFFLPGIHLTLSLE